MRYIHIMSIILEFIFHNSKEKRKREVMPPKAAMTHGFVNSEGKTHCGYCRKDIRSFDTHNCRKVAKVEKGKCYGGALHTYASPLVLGTDGSNEEFITYCKGCMDMIITLPRSIKVQWRMQSQREDRQLCNARDHAALGKLSIKEGFFVVIVKCDKCGLSKSTSIPTPKKRYELTVAARLRTQQLIERIRDPSLRPAAWIDGPLPDWLMDPSLDTTTGVTAAAPRRENSCIVSGRSTVLTSSNFESITGSVQNDNMICVICQENLLVGDNVVKLTRCGHTFHDAPTCSLVHWLERSGFNCMNWKCPLCKGSVAAGDFEIVFDVPIAVQQLVANNIAEEEHVDENEEGSSGEEDES